MEAEDGPCFAEEGYGVEEERGPGWEEVGVGGGMHESLGEGDRREGEENALQHHISIRTRTLLTPLARIEDKVDLPT